MALLPPLDNNVWCHMQDVLTQFFTIIHYRTQCRTFLLYYVLLRKDLIKFGLMQTKKIKIQEADIDEETYEAGLRKRVLSSLQIYLSRDHLRLFGAGFWHVIQLQYWDWFIKEQASGPAVQWSSGPVVFLSGGQVGLGRSITVVLQCSYKYLNELSLKELEFLIAKAELPLESIFFALNFLPWEFKKNLEIKKTKTSTIYHF